MSSWIRPEAFSSYPSEGRALAVKNLETLRQLPAALLPVFLGELKTYDWQFPIEQHEILRRIAFVQANPASVSSFNQISVPHNMERAENIAVPQRFLAEMSAYLWSSLQMDTYRKAAGEFIRLYRTAETPVTPIVPRLAVIMIGKEANVSPPLFQKLRPHGQIRTSVRIQGSVEAILKVVQERSTNHAEPYAHWYVDGGDPLPGIAAGLTQLSWPELAPMNRVVLGHIQSCIANGSGPEVLQQQLAEMPLHGLSTGAVAGRSAPPALRPVPVRSGLRNPDLRHNLRPDGHSRNSAPRSARHALCALRPAPAPEALQRYG